jgi:ketosteroid isomerase-like protein
MSRENVEVVRRGFEIFMEEIENDARAARLFDEGVFAPTATLTPARNRPDWTIYVGQEGLTEFLRAWTEDFSEWKLWPEEIIDTTGDRVVVVVRQSGTGKASGAVVELHFGLVFTLQGGQVVDQREFLDPAEALDAVGLRE